MTVSAHLSTLNEKKSVLDDSIEYEMKRPLPNFLKLSELKRRKMILKQQIVDLLKQRKTA